MHYRKKTSIQRRETLELIGSQVDTPMGPGRVVIVLEDAKDSFAYVELTSPPKEEDTVVVSKYNESVKCVIIPVSQLKEQTNQNAIKEILKLEEVKPCPFCGTGNSQVEVYESSTSFWNVGCGRCGSHSGVSRDKDAVIKSWNSRPD